VRLTPADDAVSADFAIVGADYFDTIGLRLLRGREFTRSEEDPVAEGLTPGSDLGGRSQAQTRLSPVVIDRLLSRRLFKDVDPLGRQILIQRHEDGSVAAVPRGMALGAATGDVQRLCCARGCAPPSLVSSSGCCSRQGSASC
jgi:hypothetical protein